MSKDAAPSLRCLARHAPWFGRILQNGYSRDVSATCLSSSKYLPVVPYSQGKTGAIASGLSEARDKSRPNWIDNIHEYDRGCVCRQPRCRRRVRMGSSRRRPKTFTEAALSRCSAATLNHTWYVKKQTHSSRSCNRGVPVLRHRSCLEIARDLAGRNRAAISSFRPHPGDLAQGDLAPGDQSSWTSFIVICATCLPW